MELAFYNPVEMAEKASSKTTTDRPDTAECVLVALLLKVGNSSGVDHLAIVPQCSSTELDEEPESE